MSKTILNLGSITYATKAKILLAGYSIKAETVKLSNDTVGCTHGIEFDRRNNSNVRQILSKHKIPFKETNL